MRLSANSLGIFIYTTLATVAFIWMAKRPVVEENQVMQFGMPVQTATTKKTIDKPELVDEKPAEEASSVEEALSAEGSSIEGSTNDSASSEPEKAEDNTSKKADSEKK